MKEKLINSLWTNRAIKQCVEHLEKDKKATAFETSCGRLIVGNNEEVQVKIIITRDNNDFISDIAMIKHENYEPNKQ